MPRHFHPGTRRTRPLRCAIAVSLAFASLTALAQDNAPATGSALESAAPRTWNIPAAPLADTLARIARDSGQRLSADPALIAGKTAAAVHGQFTPADAARQALAGTGLELVVTEGGTLSLRPAPVRSKGGETTLAPVTVTAGTPQESAWGPVKGYVAGRSATGTKTDTPIIETPQSISVVTKAFADAIGATRLRDAMGYTPGVNIAPYGSDSRYDWIFIRGFDASSPGFYLDGLQLRNAGTWGIWRTENYALERIEILRGPSSVLYGQNIPGGMVNAVSKRPSADTSREIQVQLGNDRRRQISGDFTGPLDEDGKLRYRVTGVFREAELPADGMPNDRVFLAPSLTWDISDQTTLELNAQYLRDKAGAYTTVAPYRGSLLANPNGKVKSHRFSGSSDFNRFDHEQALFGYRLEHRFNDVWQFRQAARYGELDSDYEGLNASAAFITVNAASPSDPANFRRVRRNAFGAFEKAREFNLDNQLQADFATGSWRHTVLAGLDYQRSTFDVVAYSGSSGTTFDLYDGSTTGSFVRPANFMDARSLLVQTGLYLQDQIKFDERWVLTLGGRYDTAEQDTDDRLAGSRSKQTDRKFSGRAGIVYLAPGGLAPYASYSESFSPNTTLNPVTGKPYGPETGKQYEIGVRYQPVGRTDSYSLAAFDLKRQNMVTNDAVTFLPRQYGEIQVRGLELEASFQPIDRLNVAASWTYTPKAEVTKSANPAEVGKQANEVSRHQASLWADYAWRFGLKAGLGLRHVGSNRGTGEGTPVKVPAYTLVDAMLGYTFDKWELALNVRNLTDKDYLAHCGYNVCNYGDARTTNLTASYRW